MIDRDILRSHQRREWVRFAAGIIIIGLVCTVIALVMWCEPGPILSAEMRDDIRGIMLAVVFADALPRVLGFGRKPNP